MTTLIADKVDFWAKNIIRVKQGYFIRIKGSIQQEDIKIQQIYHLIIELQVHETKTDRNVISRQIHNYNHRFQYNLLNNWLNNRQKINKDRDLLNTLYQFNLIDIYKTLILAKQIIFKGTWNIYQSNHTIYMFSDQIRITF